MPCGAVKSNFLPPVSARVRAHSTAHIDLLHAYVICVFIYPCTCMQKKCSVFICFFLILPFLRNASQTCSDSLSRADLICIFLSCMKACVVFACLDDIRFLKAGLSGCVLYQQIRRKAEEFLCPFLQQIKQRTMGLNCL